ncbi:hypothetical protein H920_12012 [Fukomys damarensis]|uniref:Uncharacterized protein n=1 Tax=Fukomys damarensis TaxID=885580 RepID=A0A091D7Z8_FUKDA|nr:hypothetical protein H920_12012 [Fukomys damarensis]
MCEGRWRVLEVNSRWDCLGKTRDALEPEPGPPSFCTQIPEGPSQQPQWRLCKQNCVGAALWEDRLIHFRIRMEAVGRPQPPSPAAIGCELPVALTEVVEQILKLRAISRAGRAAGPECQESTAAENQSLRSSLISPCSQTGLPRHTGLTAYMPDYVPSLQGQPPPYRPAGLLTRFSAWKGTPSQLCQQNPKVLSRPDTFWLAS